eukprot:172905-Chlamydomonas_euryale.AAC.4
MAYKRIVSECQHPPRRCFRIAGSRRNEGGERKLGRRCETEQVQERETGSRCEKERRRIGSG